MERLEGRLVRLNDREILVSSPKELEACIRNLAREQGIKAFTVEVNGRPIKPEDLQRQWAQIETLNITIRRYMVGACG